jgi:hypothetical protein
MPNEEQRLAHDERVIAEHIYGLGNPRKAEELGNKKPSLVRTYQQMD